MRNADHREGLCGAGITFGTNSLASLLKYHSANPTADAAHTAFPPELPAAAAINTANPGERAKYVPNTKRLSLSRSTVILSPPLALLAECLQIGRRFLVKKQKSNNNIVATLSSSLGAKQERLNINYNKEN
jgi:hypothetical protein